jgi:hypothetical protein
VIQTVFIPGPLPGMNEFSGKTSGWAYRRAKSIWALKIALAIRQAKLQPVKQAYLSYVWMEPSRRRDPDNFTSLGRKFILDQLVNSKILPDDGWDEIAGQSDSWAVDKDKPGVYVILETQ